MVEESRASGPYRYLVVGSGWRSGVFLRMGTQFPETLAVTGVVSHTQARADEVAATWHLPTGTDLAEAVRRDRPDFVVVLVPWDRAPVITEEIVRLGVPVLCETPPAADMDGLRAAWAALGSSGLVQSAEQYLRYPGNAARLQVIARGLIGTPTSVHVSQTHLYHEVSKIRALLGAGMSPTTVIARDVTVPLVEPQDLGKWTGDGEAKQLTNTFAHLTFESGGFGTYDFTTRQWWNPLRVNRLVVNGSRGEILDDRVTFLQGSRRVTTMRLERRHVGDELTFEGREVDHISFGADLLWTNQWLGRGLTDDDLAVADHLVAMGKWVRGDGPEPYPMAEACQDHAIGLAIEESARTGMGVTVADLPWM